MLDILLTPKVVTDAWDYFNNVQTKDRKYTAVPPARSTSRRSGSTRTSWRSTAPEMRKYYYDPTKFKTYLEQFGIKYPTVKGIAQ